MLAFAVVYKGTYLNQTVAVKQLSFANPEDAKDTNIITEKYSELRREVYVMR